MNKLPKKLRARLTGKKGMKNSVISIVILLEVIALLIVGTFAWVETVSSIKITNEANTVGTIKNDTKYTDMMIGDKQGTIDLLDYFEPSGDMHLAPASSADGKTFYFPKANIGSNVIYRKGTVSDKNTTYLSASFRLKADTNADFFFWKDSTHSISVDDNIRVSVTAYTEGENPEGTYDPTTGKLISNTKIYSNLGGGDAIVIDNTNGTLPSSNNTHVEKFSDHVKGKSSSARLFAVGANETKYVTINVWLQTDNSDLTSNMSVAQAINNLGITSSLTPRHVTLLPTPTWDDSGATFYAWCWDAPNSTESRLYKLNLDPETEHYYFDYNGTFRKTVFVRAVPNCTVQEGVYSSWPFSNSTASGTAGYWNQTVNISIPNDPVDPTFIIETINGGSQIDDYGNTVTGLSTGSWHDPATVKVALCTGQGGDNPWGTLTATSYIGAATSSHVIESTKSSSQKHKDTVHAWPGKILSLTASAKPNYAFVGWYDNPEGIDNSSGDNDKHLLSSSATYTPNAPSTASEITYYAKFKETRTLTIYRTVDGNQTSTVAAGTITVNGSTTATTGTSKSVTVDKGSSVTFSASAATGYTFQGFYTTREGNSTVSSPVTLDGDTPTTTYYARFTTNTHTVNLNTIGSTGSTVQYGSETASTSVTKTDVKYNTSVTIKANPAGGYKFVGWYTNSSGTGTAASTSASYTFTMGDDDVTYYAKFETLNIYLTGYLNGTDVSTTSTDRKFTFSSSTGKYTLSYKFTGNSEQFVTIYDGSKAYHPASANAGSGTAGTVYNSYIAGDDSTNPAPYYKWRVPACKGTTVSFTWDPGTKVLSWSITSRELYLKPNSNWTQSSARFAAYVYGNGEAWYSMTSAGSGYYKVTVPASYPNIIFARMKSGTTTNNWDNKWNQTGDLTIPADKNCFTVPDGAWDGSTTTWSLY